MSVSPRLPYTQQFNLLLTPGFTIGNGNTVMLCQFCVMFKSQSITQRLFFSFGILVLNITLITGLALYYLNRSNRANALGERFAYQRLQIQQLLSTDLDFLRFETLNVNYFRTNQSSLLLRRITLMRSIQHTQTLLRDGVQDWSLADSLELQRIDSMLTIYDSTFQLLVEKINVRGFKDYGLEGSMREEAHRLEQETGLLLSDVLTLRRHEKDFLLRKEKQYIDKFNILADQLLIGLRKNKRYTAVITLENYQHEFNILTEVTFEIGITPQTGYLGKLNHHTESIFELLTSLDETVRGRKEQIIEESALWFIGISVALIFSSCMLTYFTSTRLARPIKKLSNSMGKFMVSEGLNERELEDTVSGDEISTLSASFIRMSRKLKSQFNEILKQNNELKTLNEELDRFIYSAAHDLKSPLASLDGLVGLAEREINSPAHKHYFTMMSTSVKKLNGFINDITDYAKNKRQALVVEKIDVAAMVLDIVESLSFLPNAERVAVNVNVPEMEFYTDRTRLEIILKNLIANSFRYLDISKSRSHLQIEGTFRDNQLHLTIEDNGIGIGKQHLEKIFQMFYRAVEHSKGTGIGLFLVKESVKMLRGKIGVKSILGQWTVFHLRLPSLKQGHDNSPESIDVIHTEYAEIL
ncbi:MAG TPA: HAMP domain-containing sensor histidine kinase [Chryseosolibacter sp.]